MAPPVTSNIPRPAQATTSFGVSADPYGLDGEDEPEPVRCVRRRMITRKDCSADICFYSMVEYGVKSKKRRLQLEKQQQNVERQRQLARPSKISITFMQNTIRKRRETLHQTSESW